MAQMFGDAGLKKVFTSYQRFKHIPVAAPMYYDLLNERFGVVMNGKRTLVTHLETRKAISEMFEQYYGRTLEGLQKTEMLKAYFDGLIKEGKELEL